MFSKAHVQNRTADLHITDVVLYQLSYMGMQYSPHSTENVRLINIKKDENIVNSLKRNLKYEFIWKIDMPLLYRKNGSQPSA